MKRALGFVVFVALLGGAVFVGLRSSGTQEIAVRDVEDLGHLLAGSGFGCRDLNMRVPGMLLGYGVQGGICSIEGNSATLYVFDSPGLRAGMEEDYDLGTSVAWVVGHNWIVALTGRELAEQMASAVGARALTDPAFPRNASKEPRSLDCGEEDLIQATTGTYPFDARGYMGPPEEAVARVLEGLQPTDDLIAAAERGDTYVEILRDGRLIGIASLRYSDAGGWLVESSSVCASARILHG